MPEIWELRQMQSLNKEVKAALDMINAKIAELN